MDEWVIYSIGDSAFLQSVLNGIAMIHSHQDGAIITTLIALGLGLGILMALLRSLNENEGQGIPVGPFVVTAIVLVGVFGWETEVTIKDAYTGQIRTVDNVPGGVVATGSFISQIGYGLTELLEQGYSDTQMVGEGGRGFGAPLRELESLRKATLDRAGMSRAIEGEDDSDLWKSWQNYVADCTMVAIDRGETTKGAIERNERVPNGDFLDQLRYDNYYYGTEIAAGGQSGYAPCPEAHDELTSYTRGDFTDRLSDMIASNLGVFDGKQAIGDALSELGQSTTEAQNYMLVSSVLPMYEAGLVAGEAQLGRDMHATMAHQAVQQRNSQWVAEETLFGSIVQPMMTFFEAFIYALTPFMALLLALGPMGIGLIGKYLMILLWVQLWTPVMSIINLYQVMSIRGDMAALTSGQSAVSLDSVAGLLQHDQMLQNWIATGGMLASSVPAITLLLIYGSAVAATHMTGRLQGGDFIDETQPTPDVANQSALLNQAGFGQKNMMSGQFNPVMEEMAPKVDIGQALSDRAESSEALVNQTQSDLQQTVGSVLTSGAESSQEMFGQAATTLRESAGQGESYTVASQLANQTEETAGLSESLSASQKQELITATEGALTAQGSTGDLGDGSGLEASVRASMANRLTDSEQFSEEEAEKLTNSLSANVAESSEQTSKYMEELANDITEGTRDASRETFSEEERDQIQNSHSEMQAARAEFQTATQAQQQFAEGQSLSAFQLAERDGATEMANDWRQQYGPENPEINQRAEEAARLFQQDPNISDGRAAELGNVTAMMQTIEDGEGPAAQKAMQNVEELAGRPTTDRGAAGGEDLEGPANEGPSRQEGAPDAVEDTTDPDTNPLGAEVRNRAENLYGQYEANADQLDRRLAEGDLAGMEEDYVARQIQENAVNENGELEYDEQFANRMGINADAPAGRAALLSQALDGVDPGQEATREAGQWGPGSMDGEMAWDAEERQKEGIRANLEKIGDRAEETAKELGMTDDQAQLYAQQSQLGALREVEAVAEETDAVQPDAADPSNYTDTIRQVDNPEQIQHSQWIQQAAQSGSYNMAGIAGAVNNGQSLAEFTPNRLAERPHDRQGQESVEHEMPGGIAGGLHGFRPGTRD